jgi:hypothetical protein
MSIEKTGTPRKTLVRTLENTGTCPVCGMNVKLNGKFLYDHGFRLKWEARQGNCFAVGLFPWEVSPEGAIRYVVALREARNQREERLEKLSQVETLPNPVGDKPKMIGRDEPFFSLALHSETVNLESQIRQIIEDIKYFDKRIAEWKPQPLPGEGK